MFRTGDEVRIYDESGLLDGISGTVGYVGTDAVTVTAYGRNYHVPTETVGFVCMALDCTSRAITQIGWLKTHTDGTSDTFDTTDECVNHLAESLFRPERVFGAGIVPARFDRIGA